MVIMKTKDSAKMDSLGSSGGLSQSAQSQSAQQSAQQQQQFCLKWNSFGSNLASAFSSLFQSESLADVTLFCEGTTFRAHKLILAACSKHFADLFEAAATVAGGGGGACVILEATSAANMAALLEFMYKGEVHVAQGALSGFLKAAESLQVKGLSIEHEKIAVAQSQHAHGGLTSPVRLKHRLNNNNNKESPEPEQGGNLPYSPNLVSPYLHLGTYARQFDQRLGNPYDTPRKRHARSPVGNSDGNLQQESALRCSVLRDGSRTSGSPANSPKGSGTALGSDQNDRGSPQDSRYNDNNNADNNTDPDNATDPGENMDTKPAAYLQQHDDDRDDRSEPDQGFAEDLRIKMETEYSSTEPSTPVSGAPVSWPPFSSRPDPHLSTTGTSGHPQHHQSSATAQDTPTTTDLLATGVWNASKLTGHKAGSVATADGKKLKCPYCERLYGYETNLRAHVRQRHQGIRVHCPFCTRTFTRNNTVRRHIAREHKQEMTLKQYQQTQQLANSAANAMTQ